LRIEFVKDQASDHLAIKAFLPCEDPIEAKRLSCLVKGQQ